MRLFAQQRRGLLAAVGIAVGLLLGGCGDGGTGSNNSGTTETTYTITFDANGGTVSPMSGTTGTDGKLASLPTPTRSNYSFDGWFTAYTGGSAVTADYAFSENTTIYARWTQTAYAITFNANGGTVSPTRDTTDTDGKLASLPTPTRSDYSFDGWFTAAIGGTAVTTDYAFSGNTTIYAQWTRESTPGPSLSYGGQTYKTVVIGNQIWMAENLNFATSEGSWCYRDSSSYCDRYGRLYDGNTAKTVCPTGWHLPSRSEWGELVTAAAGNAGTKLKSTYGWANNGNGTDEFGFSALPGGCRSSVSSFIIVGSYGYWWTVTGSGDGFSAYAREMGFDYGSVKESARDRSYGYSVRCLMD